MGREIRRVPPCWEHPRFTEETTSYKNNIGEYRPCYDETYEDAADEWLLELAKWEAGDNPDRYDKDLGCRYYWDYEDGVPDATSYRPVFTEEPTWFQVYETVSEGTPVTPPFSTEAALVDYLSENGDFWDQSRGDRPPSRKNAQRFVSGGYAPSMMVIQPKDGSQGVIAVGINAMGLMGEEG